MYERIYRAQVNKFTNIIIILTFTEELKLVNIECSLDSLGLRLAFWGRGTGLSKPHVLVWLSTKAAVIVANEFEEPREVWLTVELSLEGSIVTKTGGKEGKE